jgi:mannosidase alpha-like ER degradation enhancer 1
VVPGYRGELLVLAQDLGQRLLPAFTDTRTGIPHPRVHLQRGEHNGRPPAQPTDTPPQRSTDSSAQRSTDRHAPLRTLCSGLELRGFPATLTNSTCTAGATTLLLEFGTLSALTGDMSFIRAAHRAMRQVFRLRSRKTNLVRSQLADNGIDHNQN